MFKLGKASHKIYSRDTIQYSTIQCGNNGIVFYTELNLQKQRFLGNVLNT